MLTIFPRTLDSSKFVFLDSFLTFIPLTLLVPLQLLILDSLLNGLPLTLSQRLFLLDVLHISFQSIDPVLELLHVLLGILHVSLLLHHELGFKLGLLDH